MPRPQTNTTRQLQASVITAVALHAVSSEEIAKRVATYRQRNVDRMAEVIHDWIDHKTPPAKDAQAWRDSWCHSCDTNDAFLGTLAQHASRIFDLGWTIEGGLTGNLLTCPTCKGAQ